MKNKKRNIKQQKIYKRRRVAVVFILILLLIILIVNISSRRNIKKIALGENALNVGGETLDLSQIISAEPNPPHMGAGMIPIKWDSDKGSWVITTKDNIEWYDYSNGKWANVMLSDGKYSSELERDKILATDGTPVKEDELGTIFTWIPRFAYSDTEIVYLKGTSILEYNYTVESCFNLEKYGANSLDLAFEGIWVGQAELGNVPQVEQKNNEMNSMENTYGLIANEKVSTITDSDRVAVEKLYEKTVGASIARPEEDTSADLINISTIKYRQVIKIVNTNKRIPIVGTHVVTSESIIIKDKYSENGIKFVTDKNGNKLDRATASISEEETQYTFYIVDTKGNIRKYKMSYGDGRPDVSKFNKNSTFYVTYNDETGEEESTIPIGEKAPAGWYNYEESKWANIVVRDNGNENYYVWIPRYMYKIRDDGSETVDIKFVDLENVWTNPENNKTVNLNNSEYKLPEAFTWTDPENENEKVQLKGFWMSKYKLRPGSSYSPEISGGSGVIRVNNVIENVGSSYTYEMYLIRDGKRIIYDESTREYVEGTEAIELKGNYTFTNVPEGNYAINITVKDKDGNYIKSVANGVTVAERVEPEKPNISEFNKALTYYVTYDNEGNEDSSIPVGENAPSGWYDYDNQQWANIVVRENGNENYYVWIPRYEYALNTTHETTKVQFIPQDKIEADQGYTIPDAFTWKKDNEDGTTEEIPLSGFWMSKYKLRGDAIYNLDASVTAGETSIKVSNVTPKVSGVTSYDIDLISKDGKILETQNSATGEVSFKGLEPGGTYAINIIAKNAEEKMVAGYSTQVTLIKIEVDISEFNKATTFYVAYNETTGEEESTIPIGEAPPENWYNYAESQWANIVVRENGNENYYVWIPRYQYVVNSSDEKVKAEFISTTKTSPDPGYKIPEAFTWEKTKADGTTEKVELSGFWMSKYKLRAGSTYSPEISGGSGVIYIKNVVENIGTNYKYEAYLINEQGQRIVKNGNNYTNGATSVPIDGNYTFTNVPAGNYAVNIIVKDKDGHFVRAVARQVVVAERIEPAKPDLTGFNKNLTFYVTYNDTLGTEESSIPIGENEPNDWYDYDTQKWANIVVRENGAESYFVWIPRYEYALDAEHETTKVKFIPVSQFTPDEGYAIPEAFSWEKTNEEGETVKIALSGFWMSKYKLRDDKTYRLDATVAGDETKIRVSDIVASSSEINFTAYLIKDGKVLESKPILQEVTFDISSYGYGKYSVLVKQWSTTNGMIAGLAKEVEIQKLDLPDLTGFNVDITYVVTYNEDGTESKQKIADILKPGAEINEDRTLKTGEIDTSKISGIWYDYTNQKWANIVTIDEEKGNTNYFVWIPRYEYVAKTTDEKVKAILIPKTKQTPDPGYKIPESFMWEKTNEDGTNEIIHLSGFWISKYKLRPGL